MFKRGLCTIYSERPKYCREFRCALLKRTSSGRVSVSRALQVIRRTRRRISVVEGLLEQLGDVDQRRTLTERLTRTTSRLTKIGLDPRLAALYSDLTLAFQGLIINIDAEFYPGSDSGIR